MLSSIYKYSPARDDFFDNYLIRATTRGALNDPFEVSLTNDFLDSAYLNKKSNKRLTEEILRETGARQYRNQGIISLTETRDNLLMWSHYAEEHKGYVIEFNSDHDFFNKTYVGGSESDPSRSGRLTRVLYRKERLKVFNKLKLEPYFHKSDEWAYEKEHRLILLVSKANEVWFPSDKLEKYKQEGKLQNINLTKKDKFSLITDDIDNTHELVDYPETMFMFKIPKSAIKSITFGVNISKTSKQKIINKLKEQKLNIAIFQAKLHDDDYRLEFQEE